MADRWERRNHEIYLMPENIGVADLHWSNLDNIDELVAAANAAEVAYEERNLLVLALAKHYPSGLGIDPTEPDWPVLYIDLPTGQVSWHFPPSTAGQGEFRAYTKAWDGHTTDEKYARLAALSEQEQDESPRG